MTTTTTAIADKDALTSPWSRLESEFERYHSAISFIPMEQARLQDDLRRYLCLRCAGFLEKLVFDCVIKYLEQNAGGPSLVFAKSLFTHAPNLNANSLSKLIGRFGDDHESRFQTFLTTPLRDSLNDLASVRNHVAHGNIAGGQKLDPERYHVLCKAIYEWFTTELLTPLGSTTKFQDDSTPNAPS